MSAQIAILEPVPRHARHPFFDLKPGVGVRVALAAVLGIGEPATRAFDVGEAPLRCFARPLTGGHYGCPSVASGAIDPSALG